MSKRLYLALFVCIALVAAPFAWLYARNGMYGTNVVLRRGGSIWPSVTPDDARLTPAVRLALQGAVGTLGALSWTEPRAGDSPSTRRPQAIMTSTVGCANSALRWS
jgi:hypothetical protein